MRSEGGVKILAGNGNPSLARAIARRISVYRGDSVAVADARVERFSDKEIFVEIFDNVRGEDVFIVQSTSNPANDNLMELLIMADALRRASARRITAVTPYFGYARQDRKTSARTPITAKLVANLIDKAGIDRLLTMDLHAGQIQGFFDMPVDNLYAAPVFALDIRHRFGDPSELQVVSPDVGGVVRARDLAKRIGAGLAIVDKRRAGPGEIESMTDHRRGRGQDLPDRGRHLRYGGHALQGGGDSEGEGRQGRARLYLARRAVRPGFREGRGVGARHAGDHRFDRTTRARAFDEEHPNRFRRAALRARYPQCRQRHLGVVAVRRKDARADLRGDLPLRLTRPRAGEMTPWPQTRSKASPTPRSERTTR
jgi:phosphoribosylpyrophosphate synthetase